MDKACPTCGTRMQHKRVSSQPVGEDGGSPAVLRYRLFCPDCERREAAEAQERNLRRTVAETVDHWYEWTGYRLRTAREPYNRWNHPEGVRGPLIDEIVNALREEV